MKGTQVHKLQAAIPVLNCLFPRSMTEKELSILLKSVLPRFMSHAEPNLNPNDTRNSRMKALRSQYGIFFFSAHYLYCIDYTKGFDCMGHNKLENA